MMRACLTALALCVCVGVAQAETGIASVYGYGRVTASGARFDPRALTAAHCTLPFGTLVKVCRIGGNCIVVRINDRGPFVRGCIIDLTPAAAHAHQPQSSVPPMAHRGFSCISPGIFPRLSVPERSP